MARFCRRAPTGPFDGLFAMRLLFLILFVVALIAWNLQRKLEESKDWTENSPRLRASATPSSR